MPFFRWWFTLIFPYNIFIRNQRELVYEGFLIMQIKIILKFARRKENQGFMIGYEGGGRGGGQVSCLLTSIFSRPKMWFWLGFKLIGLFFRSMYLIKPWFHVTFRKNLKYIFFSLSRHLLLLQYGDHHDGSFPLFIGRQRLSDGWIEQWYTFMGEEST